MTASHLLLGVSLLAFAIWLQWTEGRGWPNESSDDDLDVRYYDRRMRVNFILALCGGLILIAGFSGPRMFVISWLLVTLALLIVVVLAGFDAIGTQRYINAKLPDLRRRLLESDRDQGDNESSA